MSDSFDELEPPDPRSSIHRAIEGLSVVAVLVAIVLWQSEGTLDAAREFLGLVEQPEVPLRVAMQPRGSDIRLYPSPIDQPSAAAQPVPAPAPGDVDTSIETASIAPPPMSVSPMPVMPIQRFPASAPMVTSSAAAPVQSSGPAAFSPAPVSIVRTVSAPPPVAAPVAAPVAVAAASPLPLPHWTAACDDGDGGFCTASQALSAPDDPSVETSWTIEKSPGGLFAVWTAPTGILVDRGMALIMGDGPAKTVPFTSCGAHSCEVRARLAGDFVDLLRRSPRISTEIVLKSGRTARFDFTREGLDAALAKLGV